MRAITIAKPGGPDVLVVADRPTPAPSRFEVRVRVRATAVNRADVLQRMGMYPAPPDAPADIPGLELAGEVDALGPDVTTLAVGDRVLGLVGGGSYAEAVVVHERALARIPDGMSFTDAAAIPEAFITAHDAMTQAHIASGETMLVHAVGSGVGTAAVQLGHALGARVLGTARTADKLERARSLGLDHGIVTANGKFATEVLAAHAPGVAAVLELVGGNYVDEDLRCIATRGRIVLVGLLAGAREQLDLARMLHKRVHLIGTQLRARPIEEKIAVAQAFATRVMPLFARGLLRPIVDTILPLDRAGDAHARMQSNAGFGKIVLEV